VASALNYVAYGLIAREIERVDSGYRSMMSVQSSLVMVPDLRLSAPRAQRKKYLPKLASGEFIGCFGLTEPDAWLRPWRHEATRAKKVDGGYVLTRQQDVDLQFSPIADVFVVWAKEVSAHARGRSAASCWRRACQGPLGTQDRRQALASRLDHRARS
jgi:glutaryl-CoA dehydrogenase